MCLHVACGPFPAGHSHFELTGPPDCFSSFIL